MQIVAVSEVSGGLYCNRDTKSWNETEAAKLIFVW